MPYTPINDGDSGLTVRTNLNSMLQELYNNLPSVIAIKNANVNTNQVIAANSKVTTIDLAGVGGAPTVRIGLTPNGQEILPDTQIGNLQPVVPDYYSANGDTLYFTISGGVVNIRIGLILNYF